MDFITNEKLTIVGAAGMIGSNMAQTAIMMHLTPNICLYDPYAQGLEGVAEEMFHCGFEGLNLTYTSDIKEALTGAKYIVSSGGAARKAGMTREDLLKGNAAIAEEFGKNVKAYCPDVKHVVVIFNPSFGDPTRRKFTIAGNGKKVVYLLPFFDNMEKGWGGRETIIGSPANGSCLQVEEVLKVVVENL